MDLWRLALYAFAAFLALRSLISLMTHHRVGYQQKLATEFEAEYNAAMSRVDRKEKDKKTPNAA